MKLKLETLATSLAAILATATRTQRKKGARSWYKRTIAWLNVQDGDEHLIDGLAMFRQRLHGRDCARCCDLNDRQGAILDKHISMEGLY